MGKVYISVWGTWAVTSPRPSPVGCTGEGADVAAAEGIPRHGARRGGLLHPILRRGPELRGDGAAEDLALPLVAAAARQRLDLDGAVAVLAGAAGLLLVLVLHAGGAGDRLAVGDARGGECGVDPIAPLDPLQGDVEVGVAEAVHHLLAGVGIAVP